MPIAIGFIGVAIVLAFLAHLNLLPCGWVDLCVEMSRRNMEIREERHEVLLPIEADERQKLIPVKIREREAAIDNRYRTETPTTDPATSQEPEATAEPEGASSDEPETISGEEPEGEFEPDPVSSHSEEDCDDEEHRRTILVPRYRSAIGPVESVAPGHAYRPAYPSHGYARSSRGFARPGYGLARPN